MYEICSKLTIKTSERYQWHHSGVFIVNFEQISLEFSFLILKYMSTHSLDAPASCPPYF